MLIIYTTCANVDEAKRLSKLIIDKKLAACVNFWPVGSMYKWEGEFKAVSETMMSIKTFESKRQEVEDLISVKHTYSSPMIAGVDIRRINRPYKEWMTQAMR
ncbi:MAG: divalent-cation tolerance protein CutA [Parcubacteria group bacterium]